MITFCSRLTFVIVSALRVRSSFNRPGYILYCHPSFLIFTVEGRGRERHPTGCQCSVLQTSSVFYSIFLFVHWMWRLFIKLLCLCFVADVGRGYIRPFLPYEFERRTPSPPPSSSRLLPSWNTSAAACVHAASLPPQFWIGNKHRLSSAYVRALCVHWEFPARSSALILFYSIVNCDWIQWMCPHRIFTYLCLSWDSFSSAPFLHHRASFPFWAWTSIRFHENQATQDRRGQGQGLSHWALSTQRTAFSYC